MICKYNAPGCGGCGTRCRVACESGDGVGASASVSNVTFTIQNIPSTVQFWYLNTVRGTFGTAYHWWTRATIQAGGIYSGADQLNGSYSIDYRTSDAGFSHCVWYGGGDTPLLEGGLGSPLKRTQWYFQTMIQRENTNTVFGEPTCPNPAFPLSAEPFARPIYLVFSPYLTYPYGATLQNAANSRYLHWVRMFLAEPALWNGINPIWEPSRSRFLADVFPMRPVETDGELVFDSCDVSMIEWKSPPPWITNQIPPDDAVSYCDGWPTLGTYGSGSYATTS